MVDRRGEVGSQMLTDVVEVREEEVENTQLTGSCRLSLTGRI